MQRVLDLLESGDRAVAAAAREQAPWLMMALRTLQTVFDPRALILGGHLGSLARLMGSALEEGVSEVENGRATELRISITGANAVLAGGVRAARDDLLAAPWSA